MSHKKRSRKRPKQQVSGKRHRKARKTVIQEAQFWSAVVTVLAGIIATIYTILK